MNNSNDGWNGNDESDDDAATDDGRHDGNATADDDDATADAHDGSARVSASIPMSHSTDKSSPEDCPTKNTKSKTIISYLGRSIVRFEPILQFFFHFFSKTVKDCQS